MARMPKDPQTPIKSLVFLIICVILLGTASCQSAATPTPENTPTITLTATSTSTPTSTFTPTPTQTTTPADTITPRPSKTPTITPTPFFTPTNSPTPTLAPLRPAVLFEIADVNGKTINWSYSHITQISYNRLNEVNDLWAFMSFQLLDRAIHHRNLTFLGDTITVYYLNVTHEFNGEMLQMQLVLGGTPGVNVNIEDIPAGGTAYIQVKMMDYEEPFDPYITHRDANRAYPLRSSDYPLLFLKELQAMLPSLPDEVILLADHPILFPLDNWPQIKLDMKRVSYLAARYQPFFEIDAYDRLADQSDFAYALRDYIIDGADMPIGLYAYSSQTLVIITGGE